MTPGPGTRLPLSIAQALLRGAIVLTANQRAARSLHFAFQQKMQAEGRVRWATTPVFALDTWLSAQWHALLLSGAETRLLLNSAQEHALWRGIIRADAPAPGPGVNSAGNQPANLDALATLAQSAWRLLALHNGLSRLAEIHGSSDYRAFQRWATAFDRLMRRERLVTAAQLPLELAADAARLPHQEVLVVDLLRRSPSHDLLFNALTRAGTTVESVTTSVPREAAHLVRAEDDADELRRAASWVATRLREHPAASIAIVLPDLEGRRQHVERAFSRIADDLASRGPAPLFEFSLGRRLAETQLVAAALSLLRWAAAPLPLSQISALLTSSAFGGSGSQDEALAAAEFDAFDLRDSRLLRPERSLASTYRLARASRRRGRLTGLIERLKAMLKVAETAEISSSGALFAQRSHSDWADAFRALLEAAGWNIAAGRDSFQFQVQRRWESALDQFASLDFDGSQAACDEALDTLTRIAQQTTFAPETTHAPIQIIGTLEAGGVPFDALWFLGADELHWPRRPAAHPLIPRQLQRSLLMPGVDAVRDRAEAEALCAQLAACAPEIVFSHAARSEEGELRPSPLLPVLQLAEAPEEAPAADPEPLALELAEDSSSVPLLGIEADRGGARVFELQAKCGFRAFAERRLVSTELESPELGLDPRRQGRIAHTVLELFWQRLGTQSALRALSPGERIEVLDECVDAALIDEVGIAAAGSGGNAWEAAYIDVQRRRLHALLGPWLSVELSRPNFSVVALESKLERVAVGPLTLDLRVDRIDQTAGGALILDYKTGTYKPTAWLGSRPDQPQLPLYAILSNAAPANEGASLPLAGIAFATLRSGRRLALQGFADSRAVLSASAAMEAATFDEQVELWRETLTALAHDFAQGRAAVDPKQYPRTCEHCGQRLLCRLDPATLAASEDDGESDPDDLLSGASYGLSNLVEFPRG